MHNDKTKETLSQLAETLIGNQIVKMNGEIRGMIDSGERVFNFTVGDFDTQVFPIPEVLESAIHQAYQQKQTNYPLGEGDAGLREAIRQLVERREGLSYALDEILVAAGGRPLIYTLFRTIVDPGDTVIYPVPSWNNNHYAHFVDARHCTIDVSAETNFHPTADQLRPYIKGASLIALSSPLNPTGTVIPRAQLQAIAELVVEENNRREKGQKKLYIMYDQIYGMLTFNGFEHENPVSLCPEVRPYVIFVDGISKCFAATGVRVGWTLAPANVIQKMKSILSHVGAWAPTPEQKATAAFLTNPTAVADFMTPFLDGIWKRLQAISTGINMLKSAGYPVDVLTPQAAIYLSVQFNLKGKKTLEGKTLETQEEVTDYLLKKAGLAIVPFPVFGAPADSSWYRLSVGNSRLEEIPLMLSQLRSALDNLTK
jgi:aspartate aminotransferase